MVPDGQIMIGIMESTYDPGGSDDLHRGTGILSIENGIVEHIKIINGGYKYIVISGDQRYGYGHIFNSSELHPINRPMIIEGNCVLKHLNAPNSTIPGIFIKENLAAISRKTGGYITIPTGNYAGTYFTSNYVFKNEMIAPMGGSGGIGSFPSNDPLPVHLHLYKFDSNPGDHINHSNCTDASRELTLNENTTYSLNTSTINNNSGININYGLQNNYPRSTSLKTRIDMNGAIPNGERFSNVFMKIITVDYRLTSELLVAQRIKGPYYYGYFNLDGIYPIKITNDH